MIDRQDAIRIVDSIDTWQAGWRGYAIESLKALPSVQPEPLWGKTVEDGRPLSDCEIIPRLRVIQKQVGGSYAIDRAIEVIEAVGGGDAGRENRMKNTLSDLNNILFEQLERLNDDELTDEEIEMQLKKTDTIVRVSEQIVKNGELAFKAIQHKDKYYGIVDKQLPPMLEGKW